MQYLRERPDGPVSNEVAAAETSECPVRDEIRQRVELVSNLVGGKMSQVSKHRCNEKRVLPDCQGRYQPDEGVLPGMEHHQRKAVITPDVPVEVVYEVINIYQSASSIGNGNSKRITCESPYT